MNECLSIVFKHKKNIFFFVQHRYVISSTINTYLLRIFLLHTFQHCTNNKSSMLLHKRYKPCKVPLIFSTLTSTAFNLIRYKVHKKIVCETVRYTTFSCVYPSYMKTSATGGLCSKVSYTIILQVIYLCKQGNVLFYH